MINWWQNFVPSNSVCNHTRDQTNRISPTRSSDFVNHSYDYRPNWTPLSPVTITKTTPKKQPVLKRDTKIINEPKSVTFKINNKGLTLEIYDPKQLTMNGQLWHFITTSRSIRILFCSSLFWLRRIFCLQVKVIIVCKLGNAIQTVTEHSTTSTDRRCKHLNDYATVQHRSFGKKIV